MEHHPILSPVCSLVSLLILLRFVVAKGRKTYTAYFSFRVETVTKKARQMVLLMGAIQTQFILKYILEFCNNVMPYLHKCFSKCSISFYCCVGSALLPWDSTRNVMTWLFSSRVLCIFFFWLLEKKIACKTDFTKKTTRQLKSVPWNNAFWPGLTPFGPLLWQVKQTVSTLFQLQPAT